MIPEDVFRKGGIYHRPHVAVDGSLQVGYLYVQIQKSHPKTPVFRHGTSAVLSILSRALRKDGTTRAGNSVCSEL